MGCSVKDVTPKEELQTGHVEITDLENFPQNIEFYTQDLEEKTLYNIQSKYEEGYFRIWNNPALEKIEDVQWPFESYKYGYSYGENLKLLEQSFFDEMYKNSNFDAYLSISKKALTVRHTDLRSFPTLKPLFKDPSLAGEGFPFDYLQNSTVDINKPIFVSHYSQDKAWAYVFSSFASGWIKTTDFVYIDDKYIKEWQKAKQVIVIKEGEPIYNEEKAFLFKTRIGMMLPIIEEDSENYTVLFVSSYKHSRAFYEKAKISKEFATGTVLKLNRENINLIVNEVLKTNYGWGGLYEQRDCSSMIRDIFTPFGIWLPRNSYVQSRVGKVISFAKLNDEEKVALIKEQGIPFETLLYKKGHILLYVGTYNDEIVALHNTWGIKTKKDDIEGRVIVGEPIFSTLKLGKNQKNYDKEAEILKNLQSMNIITESN
jgi:hypothetical protein